MKTIVFFINCQNRIIRKKTENNELNKKKVRDMAKIKFSLYICCLKIYKEKVFVRVVCKREHREKFSLKHGKALFQEIRHEFKILNILTLLV